MTHVRLAQVQDGVRVYGAEVRVHFAGDGETVDALNGDFVADVHVSTVPQLGAWRAVRVARSIEPETQLAGAPELVVYTRRIDADVERDHLAWLVTLTSETPPARTLFVVDAHDGSVIKTRDELCSARYRRVYDLGGATEGPGQLVRAEGWSPTGDVDVDEAYEYSGDAYDYFLSRFGRDGYDGQGATIVSRVHLGIGLVNAFWTGSELLFGDGMTADDIVVHEYVHALTQETAGLIYEDESGALSEAYSDIFGELVDQLNASGNDSVAARWQLGEDSPVGAFRDMADPGRLGQPSRVSSWRCTAMDNGGVHSNSGIMNKAAQLIAEGGTFNDELVQGIGLEKMGRVHYRALTQYLTPAATVLSNYLALNQACFDLVEAGVFEVSDCVAVHDALTAVEMYRVVVCNITCPVQQASTALPEDEGPGGPPARADVLGAAYRLRTRLRQSPAGRRLAGLFYEHAGELSRLVRSDAELREQAALLLARLTPELEARLDGASTARGAFAPHVEALAAALLRRLERADPESGLSRAIARERAALGLEGLGARPLGAALDELLAR